MNAKKICQASIWYNALTLNERVNSLYSNENNTNNLEIDHNLAQKQIQRWREMSPFSNQVNWTQRLTLTGLKEKDFGHILGEKIESLKNRISVVPEWLQEIEQAFTNSINFNGDTNVFLSSEKLQEQDAYAFLSVVEPMVNQACNKLDQKIQSLIQTQSHVPFDVKTIISILLENLLSQLIGMLHRTILLELNVARLQGILKGNTSEERFKDFLKHLQDHRKALELLQEYPVLARQTQICINHWLEFSEEFLWHLCNDWNDIKRQFIIDKEPGLLIALKSGTGDSHCGGRSVIIVKFDSGFQIVYKPRSLSVDIHFQELLTWLNHRGNHPAFKTLKVLDRVSYGWVEFVRASKCTTVEEVKRFYQRQGGYLALLYALGATDFHGNNLIAVGEHPILIDLESLFHPHFAQVIENKSAQIINETMTNSVLSVGLLPERRWLTNEYEGIDLSGLGLTEGQLTPHRLPYWESKGTDEMHLQRKRMKITAENNRPILKDIQTNILDYTDCLILGFTNLYQLLLEYRDELLKYNGLLARFAEDEVRVIVRDTYTYSALLAESYHPDVLRNALDRDRLFDRLWLRNEQQPYLVKLIAAECNDLWKGDVPIFKTNPNSQNIWNNSGTFIKNFLKKSGMAVAKSRIQKMGAIDLNQQLWLIRASLTTLVTVDSQQKSLPYPLKKSHKIATEEKLLIVEASKIGDYLKNIALSSEQYISWMGVTLVNERNWILKASGLDLYDGLPGILMFLAYLGHITKKEDYTNLAKLTLRSLQDYIKTQPKSIKLIGAFNGWGGVIYTLTHLASLWQRRDLLDQAQKIVELLPDLIEQDDQFDLIGGSAGCIVSLITLYRSQPSASILEVARQCGEHLISKAQKMPQGIGWLLKNQVNALTGFSHGNAGIAWALLQLADLTGDIRFKETALEAIAYERSLFVPKMNNWADLRNLEKRVLKQDVNLSYLDCHNAWCHGAPGIGLARFASLNYVDDAQMRVEIDIALKTTINQGFGHNHSLCHGDLGNLELLLQASLNLDHTHWQPQVDRFTAMIVESIHNYGWLCGVPLQVETPGLMTGIAGIGYQLLRLAHPELVPSVLLLEPVKTLNSEL